MSAGLHNVRETGQLPLRPELAKEGSWDGNTRASLLRDLLDKHVEPAKGTTSK